MGEVLNDTVFGKDKILSAQASNLVTFGDAFGSKCRGASGNTLQSVTLDGLHSARPLPNL